ncbi:hypothetical protein VKT23_008577 [Stygiomarasmius scandens]|uniref:Uncharacterized protein n=1 Tax=Marasmiellus scandens TaxID=2682957 RepID=A0ABR1JJD6_9AGAR
MPLQKQSTRRKKLGAAAYHFPGDRVAVVRSISVLIAELLVHNFGCPFPTVNDAQGLDDNHRVLLNVDVGDYFGCWYVEVYRYLHSDQKPVVSSSWLTEPGRWQRQAMTDPRMQWLIILRARADWSGQGLEPDGLPLYVIDRYGDRSSQLTEEIVDPGWDYLTSLCRPFVKGSKTPRERELFYNPNASPPRPWNSRNLLAMRPVLRPRHQRSQSRSRSPKRCLRSPRRRSRSSSRESHSRSDSPDRYVQSHSPLVTAGSRGQLSTLARTSTIGYNGTRSRNSLKRQRVPDPAVRNPYAASKRSISSFSSPVSSYSSRSSPSASTTSSSRRGSTRKSFAAYSSPDGSPSGSEKAANRGRGKGKDRARTPLTSSPALSITTLPSLDSDSDLPTMEELYKEFTMSYSVMAFIWLKSGEYAEVFLMDVTEGSTTLARQKMALGEIRVEPDLELQMFRDSSWTTISRGEVFVAQKGEKVYLRAVGVTHGPKMPGPDLIEID